MRTLYFSVSLLLLGTTVCSALPIVQGRVGTQLKETQAAALVEHLGPPTKVVSLPNGDEQYIYEKSSKYYPESYGGYGVDTLNPKTRICRSVWRIDKKGNVYPQAYKAIQCESV